MFKNWIIRTILLKLHKRIIDGRAIYSLCDEFINESRVFMSKSNIIKYKMKLTHDKKNK